MVADSSSPRCQGIKKDGTACQALASNGKGRFCLGHDPDLAEQRAQARRKGGQNKARATRARKALPSRLQSIAELLERALQEVYSGDLEPRQATALASLSGALVRLYETSALEQRMASIEEVLHELGRT